MQSDDTQPIPAVVRNAGGEIGTDSNAITTPVYGSRSSETLRLLGAGEPYGKSTGV